MSATAEQFGGALGIAAFYLVLHTTYLSRLHTLVDASPLADLIEEQYAALRNHLQAAEETGLNPATFDASLRNYLELAFDASARGYAFAFGGAAIIAILGVVACALLVRKAGHNTIDTSTGEGVFGTAAAVGSAAGVTVAPKSPRNQAANHPPETPN